MGLEPTISAGKRLQTYALERAANGTWQYYFLLNAIIRPIEFNLIHRTFHNVPVITNIYNKKTKGPTLMELFTNTEKPKKFF